MSPSQLALLLTTDGNNKQLSTTLKTNVSSRSYLPEYKCPGRLITEPVWTDRIDTLSGIRSRFVRTTPGLRQAVGGAAFSARSTQTTIKSCIVGATAGQTAATSRPQSTLGNDVV